MAINESEIFHPTPSQITQDAKLLSENNLRIISACFDANGKIKDEGLHSSDSDLLDQDNKIRFRLTYYEYVLSEHLKYLAERKARKRDYDLNIKIRIFIFLGGFCFNSFVYKLAKHHSDLREFLYSINPALVLVGGLSLFAMYIFLPKKFNPENAHEHRHETML